jgi:hypothetical protein
MRRGSGWRRFLSGSMAGLAGSVLMQLVQVAGMKLAPRHMPPVRRDPGEYMVEKFEEALRQAGGRGEELAAKIPAALERGAAQALGLGYGLSFALLFAASRRKVRNVALEGSALGLATWAAGYLGWLPAAGLMPPVHRQKPVQVIGGIASHLAFGVFTVALYEKLRKKTVGGSRQGAP